MNVSFKHVLRTCWIASFSCPESPSTISSAQGLPLKSQGQAWLSHLPTSVPEYQIFHQRKGFKLCRRPGHSKARLLERRDYSGSVACLKPSITVALEGIVSRILYVYIGCFAYSRQEGSRHSRVPLGCVRFACKTCCCRGEEALQGEME